MTTWQARRTLLVPARWLATLVCTATLATMIAHGSLRPALAGAQATATRSSASWLSLALADGSVLRIDSLSGQSERIDASAFGHLFVETSTQLAADTKTGRLWYADTHTAIRSLLLSSNTAGPTLGPFADAALVGCSAVSDGRPFAIDVARRRFIVPVGTGGMLIYDADSLALVSSVSASVLQEEPGLLPAVAADEQSGAIWYSAADGSLLEIDGRHLLPTGRRIPYGGSPHLVRALSAQNGILYVLGSNGSLRAYELKRLTAITVPPLPASIVPVGLAAGG